MVEMNAFKKTQTYCWYNGPRNWLFGMHGTQGWWNRHLRREEMKMEMLKVEHLGIWNGV